MFFFIGGIQPKTRRISNNPRPCPSCGYHAAYLKRVDSYLSLFFIPVFQVKRGDTVLMCEKCGVVLDKEGRTVKKDNVRCRHCGQNLSGNFTFCPHCGNKTAL